MLYNPNTNNEGIYTVSTGGQDTVISFENTTDARKYISLLKQRGFPQPEVCRIETNVICNFCDNEGFNLKYIRRGKNLNPLAVMEIPLLPSQWTIIVLMFFILI